MPVRAGRSEPLDALWRFRQAPRRVRQRSISDEDDHPASRSLTGISRSARKAFLASHVPRQARTSETMRPPSCQAGAAPSRPRAPRRGRTRRKASGTVWTSASGRPTDAGSASVAPGRYSTVSASAESTAMAGGLQPRMALVPSASVPGNDLPPCSGAARWAAASEHRSIPRDLGSPGFFVRVVGRSARSRP
jgi:hypothetical protein